LGVDAVPAHVVFGDTFLVAERIRTLRDEAGAADLMDSNRQRVTAGQVPPAEVLAMCYSMPFLEPTRLVEVEGALATQEPTGNSRPGPGSRGRGNRRSSGDLGGWGQIAEAIPQFPDTTMLVFVDGAITDRNPLLRALVDHATVHRQSAPTGAGLDRWIKQTAEAKGASIIPPAIRAMSEMVGNDLWTLDRELEKLSLYATGRSIEEADIQELVSQVREASIFGAVDAILEGNPGLAVELLRQLARDGRDPSYIITMVARQLRLIALAKDLTQQGMAPNDVGSQIGVTAQYPLRKTLEQSRRLSWDDLNRRYRRLLDADLAIKRGRQEPDAALELMVADLSGGARRRG
jgi:DNA polymerase-3 subunit delta